MKRVLRLVLLLLFALLLGLVQALLSPRHGGQWPVFDIPLVVVILVATQYPSLGAIAFAWFAGFAQDAFTGELLGLNAFAKMVVAVGVLFCLGWTEIKGFGFSLVMVVLGTVAEVLAGNLMSTLAGQGTVPMWIVSGHMLLGNVLLFTILYLLVRRRRKDGG